MLFYSIVKFFLINFLPSQFSYGKTTLMIGVLKLLYQKKNIPLSLQIENEDVSDETNRKKLNMRIAPGQYQISC